MLILYEGRGFGRPGGAFPDEPSCFDCMRQLVDMAIALGHCESSAFRRIAKKTNKQKQNVTVTGVRREAKTGHLFQHAFCEHADRLPETGIRIARGSTAMSILESPSGL